MRDLRGSRVPAERISPGNAGEVDPEGAWVLYWMTSARRLEWNYGLERAIEWGEAIRCPLLVFEAIRIDYPWASERLHRFCLEGMREHRRRLAAHRVGYFPYVEREAGEGKGLLEALAAQATVVIADEFPSFFLPRMVAAAGSKLVRRMEVVDSNGILPLRSAGREFNTAFSFRRYLQGALPRHLEEAPSADPLSDATLPPFSGLPPEIAGRWPPAEADLLEEGGEAFRRLSLNSRVKGVSMKGGRSAAVEKLDSFLARALPRYVDERNDPDAGVTSGLSPYLHWGHISSHEIVHRILDMEDWTPDRLGPRPSGKRTGWWGLTPGTEAFLDQLITWRELGYGTAFHRDDAESYDSLPEWARATLDEHREDPRPWVYDLERFEAAETHDPLWNAAQRELRETGVIHNYLRMLWGKKILEWSESPEEGLRIMLELNNRWALDGRNPNSTSGIFWVMGRYDRGWPERPIYGKIRSMSSDSTKRKVLLHKYMNEFG